MPIFGPGATYTNTCATSVITYPTDELIMHVTASTTSGAAWYVWANQVFMQATAATAWGQWIGACGVDDFPAERERMRTAKVEAGLAQKRARALLIQHLSPAQRKTYEEKAYFDVEVSGKTYRIRQGTHGNVRLLEKPAGARVLIEPVERVSYCAQPDGVPTEDSMLAQKLMLETDERKFLEIANWTDLATGRLIDKRLALQEMR